MTAKLKYLHFQLTGDCNLHCKFCGQNRGLRGTGRTALPLQFWEEMARQARDLAAPCLPEITLWGGEPLLYPQFDELARSLFEKQLCRLEIVTNGTLIRHHAEALCDFMDEIFVSVDGNRALTDAVRGDGTYDALSEGIACLGKRRGRLSLMAVVSDDNVDFMAELPMMLAHFHPDRVILGQLMYLPSAEVAHHRRMARECFGQDYPELAGWSRDDDAGYLEKLRRGIADLNSRQYPFEVQFTAHSYPDHLDAPCCQMPWQRLHIRNDGACGFCTDYFGFSAGSARQSSLEEIFYGPMAEKFRQAVSDNVLDSCRHCPWRLQQ